MTEQSTYANIMLRLQNQMAVRFIPSVYRALKAQNSKFIQDLKNYGLATEIKTGMEPARSTEATDSGT